MYYISHQLYRFQRLASKKNNCTFDFVRKKWIKRVEYSARFFIDYT